ncbi:MAG: shikimate dehydrogenase [Alphaproteobacteria bacterium]|nr:shikimate dehydrogenase [Alphaproteobacteria bacterium]
MISGTTRLIAHVGYPTAGFRSPRIYNPWFAARGIDAVVMPMGVERPLWPDLIRPLFRLRNIIGALVTMPLKVDTAALVDDLSVTARIAGACNAVRATPEGKLEGEMFDGEGFVAGMRRAGRDPAGLRALVVGAGGVGSAIAASLAHAGVGALALHDVNAQAAEALATRLRQHYPALALATGSTDPAGHDIVVNATPLGMHETDPLPLDATRLTPTTFVGEVVLRPSPTPLLREALARGCHVQQGEDMLFEQIPAYLAWFGLGPATPAQLRDVALPQ